LSPPKIKSANPSQETISVVLGLLALNCDWLKIPLSQKSFPGLGSQMFFSVETSDSQKYVYIRRPVSFRQAVIFDIRSMVITGLGKPLKITNLMSSFLVRKPYTLYR